MSGERQGQQAGVQGAAAALRPQSSLPGPLLHFESENSEGLRLRRECARPAGGSAFPPQGGLLGAGPVGANIAHNGRRKPEASWTLVAAACWGPPRGCPAAWLEPMNTQVGKGLETLSPTLSLHSRGNVCAHVHVPVIRPGSKKSEREESQRSTPSSCPLWRRVSQPWHS